MIRQRTLKSTIRAAGVGLHTGRKIYLTLRPAGVDAGIQFRRTDVKHAVTIPAHALLVEDTSLATTLRKDGVDISTVEHLMAAFAGLGIDNCLVELSGREVPIMDGSAAPFVFLIQSAGIVEQNAAKRFIRIRKPIVFEMDGKSAILSPFNGFKADFTIQYDHPLFDESHQYESVDFSTTSFVKEISRARTYGFVKDIETLRAKNLILGGSTDNAIVLDEYRVLNEDGLRYSNEFVRHKILDAIGDLYLMGHSLIGEFSGVKSGHELNNLLVREMLNQPDCWEEVAFDDVSDAPISYSHPVEVLAV